METLAIRQQIRREVFGEKSLPTYYFSRKWYEISLGVISESVRNSDFSYAQKHIVNLTRAILKVNKLTYRRTSLYNVKPSKQHILYLNQTVLPLLAGYQDIIVGVEALNSQKAA